MKIGFIGDIVGKPGRLIIKRHLKRLKQEHFVDFMIANYENASHGFGLTEKNCIELLGYGIDMMTGGNHSFDKRDEPIWFQPSISKGGILIEDDVWIGSNAVIEALIVCARSLTSSFVCMSRWRD